MVYGSANAGNAQGGAELHADMQKLSLEGKKDGADAAKKVLLPAPLLYSCLCFLLERLLRPLLSVFVAVRVCQRR
jgi:hypothetical protein